jgi:glutamate-1-semialdehyde 2,1-aminomutase
MIWIGKMSTASSEALNSLIERNNTYIPGGISSANRMIDPAVAFVRGEGAYIWDINDKRYVDFHAGFAPYLLGHNFGPVNKAVIDVLASGDSLFGAGMSYLEGKLAELICETIPCVDKVTFLNTGSEATSLAIRLGRAITGRRHFIVMQGGYNGNHDELACNVINSIDEIGPFVSPGEYPLRPLGAGTTIEQTRFVHVINFNDLDSVRYVCRRYPVAALITEPVLQNVGVICPSDGYLEGLRKIADEYGFILVFDEVKTGFRHSLGGYSEIAAVTPDLAVYGKSVANGFPLALLGGKTEFMNHLNHPDVLRRPFVAGTYNGHPIAIAAAIRTIEYLIEHRESLYHKLDSLGKQVELGIQESFARHGIKGCVARQGSAFSFYLMSQAPKNLHDIIQYHDMKKDLAIRCELLKHGVFFMPIATKQCSISAAHTSGDIEFAIECFDRAVAKTCKGA